MCHSSMAFSWDTLGFGFSVVGKVVIAVGDCRAGNFDHGRVHAVEHQRDERGSNRSQTRAGPGRT